MALEQLIRTYVEADLPQVFDSDAAALAKKGWQVASQKDSGPPRRTLTVIYTRSAPGTSAVQAYAAEAHSTAAAPIRSPSSPPLPMALAPLAPEEHNYRLGEATTLAAGTITTVAVFAVGNLVLPALTPIGFVFAFLTMLYALRTDRFGMRTMRGWLRPKRMDKEEPAPGMVVVWLLGFPIVLPVYTAQVIVQFLSGKRLTNPIRTAQLEARMGIMPVTIGTCRQCGRDLQAGAEFCAYCGTSVIEHPKICPNCGTTALPDARFCPQCRTLLA